MGLLDLDMSTPEGQGFNSALMAAAQALLTPRSQGGGMGAAFGAFPQAIDRAKQNAMREQLMALQRQQVGLQTDKLGFDMEQARAQQEAARVRQAQFAQLVSGLSPDQQGIAQALGPDYFKALAPQAPKLETIFTPDGQEQKAWIRGPGSDPVPVGGAKQAPMPWEYEQDGQGGFRMKPGVLSAKTQVAQAGAGRNNVVFKQEGEESKTVGKFFGDQYADIQKAGIDAYGKVNRLSRMEQLLSGLETGKFTPAMTEVKSALDSLGIKIDDKLGSAQAAQALSNELALQMRNPSGGAGMPGAMSDADRNFLSATVPGLAKTTGGNSLLIETAKRLAQRDQQVAQMAREYRKQNGHLDEGFYQQLQQFSEANPLFKGMDGPSGAAPALPAGWAVQKVE